MISKFYFWILLLKTSKRQRIRMNHLPCFRQMILGFFKKIGDNSFFLRSASGFFRRFFCCSTWLWRFCFSFFHIFHWFSLLWRELFRILKRILKKHQHPRYINLSLSKLYYSFYPKSNHQIYYYLIFGFHAKSKKTPYFLLKNKIVSIILKQVWQKSNPFILMRNYQNSF